MFGGCAWTMCACVIPDMHGRGSLTRWCVYIIIIQMLNGEIQDMCLVSYRVECMKFWLTTKLNIQEYNKFVATLLVLLLYRGEDMDGSYSGVLSIIMLSPFVCYHVFCHYAQQSGQKATPTGSVPHWLD